LALTPSSEEGPHGGVRELICEEVREDERKCVSFSDNDTTGSTIILNSM